MNYNEFMDYINSFNKNAGEYTKDEAFEIGKRFKDLEIKPMTWKELATKLGYSNGEALRGLVKNRLTKDGLLNSDSEIIDDIHDKIINNEPIDNDELNEEIEQKLSILFKEQVKYRDLLATYRRKLRDEARIEVMVDAIKDTIKDLKALPQVNYLNTRERLSILKRDSVPNEAVLLLSDLHIGVECDNFYNQYNSKIASERMSILVANVIDYCQRNSVQRLNILNLGDLIHGIIHVSARVEQEFDVINQVMVASEILSQALNLLQEAAPEVIYRSAVDNHSRIIADKNEHIEKENFSKLIDWYIQERLKNTKIQFVNDNLDDTLGKFTLLNGQKLMFAHGHLENYNSAVQNFVGATKEFIDYICIGHWHCEKIKNFQDARVIVNGSIVGTEQYALNHRLFSHPAQYLLIFENTNFMPISIDLSTERKR